MPDFAAALKARIIAQADIGDAVHWVIVPADTPLPYARLQIISDVPDTHLKGEVRARTTRIQADFFAASWGAAREMANKAIDAVRLPADFAGIRFGLTEATRPRDLGEDVPGKGHVFRASADLLVRHRPI